MPMSLQIHHGAAPSPSQPPLATPQPVVSNSGSTVLRPPLPIFVQDGPTIPKIFFNTFHPLPFVVGCYIIQLHFSKRTLRCLCPAFVGLLSFTSQPTRHIPFRGTRLPVVFTTSHPFPASPALRLLIIFWRRLFDQHSNSITSTKACFTFTA